MLKVKKFNPFESSFLGNNLRYLLLGVLLGLVNLFFFGLGRKEPFTFDDIWITMMFNITISLSITNLIWLMQTYVLKHRKLSSWRALLWFYPCIIIGLLIGYEISYFILHVKFGVDNSFQAQWKNLKYGLATSLIVGTTVYIFATRKENYRLRLKEKEFELLQIKEQKTQAELQTLQAKINPHFLYNSLNSIASLIHDDAIKAEEMVINLSKLFRYAINNQADNFTTVREEFDIVKTYFAIEKIRFGDRIEVEMTVSPEIYSEKIPRFLIQPLAENAVKHGVSKMGSKGIIKVNVEELDNAIRIKISDNGPAFGDGLTTGYGLQSTFDKLKLLYKDNYKLQITESPEKAICIIIPKLHEQAI